MKFGSEELHLALRAASDTNDLSKAAELLYEPVRKTARFFFANRREFFSIYSREDQEDAIHDALLYMLEKLSVIAYPPNEGIPNYSYYAKFVLHGLCQSRQKLIHIANQASTDAPAIRSKGNGEVKEQNVLELIPSGMHQPEQTVLVSDMLAGALRAFFSLPNEPGTLAAVGLIILNEALGLTHMSLKGYAEYLNGQPVSVVLNRIEKLLATLSLDVHVLEPVRKRLRDAGAGSHFSGVTEKKLANRKNSIISRLRTIMKPTE